MFVYISSFIDDDTKNVLCYWEIEKYNTWTYFVQRQQQQHVVFVEKFRKFCFSFCFFIYLSNCIPFYSGWMSHKSGLDYNVAECNLKLLNTTQNKLHFNSAHYITFHSIFFWFVEFSKKRLITIKSIPVDKILKLKWYAGLNEHKNDYYQRNRYNFVFYGLKVIKKICVATIKKKTHIN